METRVYSLNDTINFGKYRGMTVEYILNVDPNYLNWANENVSWFKIHDVVRTKLIDKLFDSSIRKHIRKIDFGLDYGGDNY